MHSVHNFDDIRPYRDEEFQTVISRLLADPEFNKVMSRYFHQTPDVFDQMKLGMMATRNIGDFQARFIVPVLNQILVSTSRGLTIHGLDHLDKSKRYLYISNHRDIILDSALMNVKMHESGFNPTEIAIGSNLLIFPWINDLVRINRSFIVKRNIPVKQMLEASHLLSHYIRETIVKGSDSIWIAQREGRAKDGNDMTQPSLLKMLNMSNKADFVAGFQDLNIVPMAISYEIEPCGNEKVAELKKRMADPNFHKTEKDDLMSMMSGLKNQKGQIHIQFGQPIPESVLRHIGCEPQPNERLRLLAEYIDTEIYNSYRLFANNFIAYDLYYRTNKYQSRYTLEQKEAFVTLTHERLRLVNEDIDDAMQLWLNMYANPVCNFEKLATGTKMQVADSLK